MSYILDALKKADAQRERDPARGIHAHPAALGPSRRAGEGPSPWIWAGAAALVAAAGAGWYAAQDRSAAVLPAQAPLQGTAAPAAASPGTPPPPASMAPSRSVAQAAPPSASARAPVAATVLPPPEPARAAADEKAHGQDRAGRLRNRVAPRSSAPVGAFAAAPAGSAAPAGAVASAIPARTAASAAAAPAKSVAATTAPTAAAAGEASVMATRLPPDAPKLAISGGVYSSTRTQRMLIVNGQVVNEGADLGAGVVLEEIRPKAAVLRFRGSRYIVSF